MSGRRFVKPSRRLVSAPGGTLSLTSLTLA